MDAYLQSFVLLANKFLDVDARKFEVFKDQLFKEVQEQISNTLSISPETEESIKILMNRLGNAMPMPELETEV